MPHHFILNTAKWFDVQLALLQQLSIMSNDWEIDFITWCGIIICASWAKLLEVIHVGDWRCWTEADSLATSEYNGGTACEDGWNVDTARSNDGYAALAAWETDTAGLDVGYVAAGPSHSEKSDIIMSDGLVLRPAISGGPGPSREGKQAQYPAGTWSSLVNPGTGDGNGGSWCGIATGRGYLMRLALSVACRTVLISSSSSNFRRIVEFQWFFIALSVLR